MSNDTTPHRQPETGALEPGSTPPGPAYDPPGAPAVQGARPAVQPQQQAPTSVADQPVEHRWTPEGLVAVPALPPERVGRGALLALVAVPVGIVLSAVIWKLGFVASVSGLVVSAGAAVLYARGSGGRVRKGIPVVAAVIVLGIAGSFFAAVAVDLYDVYPQLDPEVASTYAGRGSFVTTNLFHPPVLGEYVRTGVLLALFGVLGAFGTIRRLVRTNATLGR